MHRVLLIQADLCFNLIYRNELNGVEKGEQYAVTVCRKMCTIFKEDFVCEEKEQGGKRKITF